MQWFEQPFTPVSIHDARREALLEGAERERLAAQVPRRSPPWPLRHARLARLFWFAGQQTWATGLQAHVLAVISLVSSPRLSIVVALIMSLLIPSAKPVHAFEVPIHTQIVRDALAGHMDDAALTTVVWLNASSDLDQGASERHFDNSKNPQDICQRWSDGIDKWLNTATDLSGPGDDAARGLKNRLASVGNFGVATHALEDFYSHTNWIELAVGARQSPGFAPITGIDCDPRSFPADLQSGYFDLVYGRWGCPGTSFGITSLGTALKNARPPKPFKYCHLQLNKDSPDSPEGGTSLACSGVLCDENAGGEQTYHEVARALATAATAKLWEALHQRILDRYGSDPDLDAECLFHKLAWGGGEACRRTPKPTTSAGSGTDHTTGAATKDAGAGAGDIEAPDFCFHEIEGVGRIPCSSPCEYPVLVDGGYDWRKC